MKGELREAREDYVADLDRSVQRAVDVDILCYTPDEFAVMKGRDFLRRALSDETVLYERL